MVGFDPYFKHVSEYSVSPALAIAMSGVEMGTPISPQPVNMDVMPITTDAVPAAHAAPIAAPISQDSSEQNARDRPTVPLSLSVRSTQRAWK